jgi:CRP-like cAMP-binding protein
MARVDARKLKDDAAAFVAKGKWRKALEPYLALEKLEPKDGAWPQRAGDMHRRLGDVPAAVAALTRAADTFSAQGFLLKAVAVCKMILEVDPTQHAVEARLASLHAARGFKPQGPRRAQFMGAVAEPEAEPASAPLVAVPLDQVVPGARRSAEIAAQGPSAVYEIPLETDPLGEEPRSPDAARSVLGRTPLFSALDEAALRRLIETVALRRLDAGEVLFRAGDAADALYVVASGEVAVRAGRPEVEVARLADGAFFGEIALLSGHPRGATIQAVAATELLVIDRPTVAKLVAGAPEVLKVLLRFMRDRLLDTLVGTNPLFRPFADHDRRVLAARFRFLDVQPDAVLVEKGGRSPGLFIMLAGEVEVDGALVPYGGHFGATSLLTRDVEPAEIRARGKALLLVLPRADVQEIIMTHPQVLEYITSADDAHRFTV